MANPIIKSTIPLVDAMGIVKGMPLSEMSEKWLKWSEKFPKEKSKLNAGLVALLDAAATMATVIKTLQDVLNVLTTTLLILQDTYNAAMSVVPGVGPANAGKLIAEKAKAALSELMNAAFEKLISLPQTIYDALSGQVEVDEGAVL